MVRDYHDDCYRSNLLFLHDSPSAEIGDVYMIIEIANGVNIQIDKTSVFASPEDAKQK